MQVHAVGTCETTPESFSWLTVAHSFWMSEFIRCEWVKRYAREVRFKNVWVMAEPQKWWLIELRKGFDLHPRFWTDEWFDIIFFQTEIFLDEKCTANYFLEKTFKFYVSTMSHLVRVQRGPLSHHGTRQTVDLDLCTCYFSSPRYLTYRLESFRIFMYFTKRIQCSEINLWGSSRVLTEQY